LILSIPRMKKSEGSFRFDVYFKIDEFQTQFLSFVTLL